MRPRLRSILQASWTAGSSRDIALTNSFPPSSNLYNSRARFFMKEPGLRRCTTTCRRTVATNAVTEKTTVVSNSDGKELGSTALLDQVRTLMRRVPHPVAIVTSFDRTAPHDGEFRGMTVSSFNTVTLYPQPVVSFNVKQPSKTLDAIRTWGRFLVHLLAPSPSTAKLARLFSKGNGNVRLSSGLGDFEFVPNSVFSQQLPVLRRKRCAHPSPHLTTDPVDFPFVFDCAYNPEYSIQVHDHMIVMGTVVRALEQPLPPNEEQRASSDKDLCLAYADTRFWKIGDEV